MDQQVSHHDVQKPEWALTRGERKRRALLAAGIEPARFPWLWVIGLGVLAIGAAVVMPLMANTPAEVVQAEAEPAAPVTKRLLSIDIATAARGRIAETLKATGSLAPRGSIALTAQVSGIVDAINVRVGDSVKAGDVLVRVDVETSEIQLRQQRSMAAATRAQLLQAESQLQRTESLAARGLTPSANVEAERASIQALQANLEALEAQVAAAEVVIRNATVTAPFDGQIATRSVEPGQVVSPGAPLVRLVDLSVMEMTAYVPVSASPGLSAGQGVILNVEGLTGQFEGVVEGISPVAADGTRTVPVLIAVANPDGQLRGGMFATGQIVLDAVDAALAVPEAAVRRDDQGAYVLRIVDGEVERSDIEIARNWASSRLVQLSSGLSDGDVYVSERLDDLVPGTKVVVEN